MIVLVRDEAAAEAIVRGASTRADAASLRVVITAESSAAAAVAGARAEHGAAPVGYLAASDAEALEAIAAGADEALHLPAIDAHGALLLLDRAALRASLRRAQENERHSAVQSEKLAALGTVVAGVAHEINNPLAAVLLTAEALRMTIGPLFDTALEVSHLAAQRRAVAEDEMARLARRAGPRERATEGRHLLDELTTLAETIAAVVRDLRVYARSDGDESLEVADVSDLIEQALRIVGREIAAHGHIERDFGSNLPKVVVPRARLVQVLTNVLVNAAHAIRDTPRPSHRVRITVRADGEAIAISISDTGPGIAPESIARIFDPFFTTKREGAGTGLGLSISRSILRRLGGDLIVESVHGVGATFIALVPLPSRDSLRVASTRPPASLRPPPVSARRIQLLVVDDDERLRRIYPRALRERYDVLVAEGGQEAIDLLSSGSEVDVILSDVAMPDVDGLQLLGWLEAERPALARRLLFVTAAAGDAPYRDLLARASNPVLEKPAAREDLYAAIDRLAAR